MNLAETCRIEVFDQDYAPLVDSYYAPLYRFALSLAKSSADACDLTQETFLIWSTKGHALRDQEKVKTWLFTTLYREFLRRRRQGKRLVAIEDLSPAEQDPADVETDLVTKMDAQLVMEALQEVDDLYREALTLYFIQDLSYLEIATVLGVPMGTVMSRISRAKIQLRHRLALKSKAADLEAIPAHRPAKDKTDVSFFELPEPVSESLSEGEQLLE